MKVGTFYFPTDYGIDIAELPVVVNHDLPRSADDHLHRIGRTARAGASGVAVSFVNADTEAHFRLIEKRQGLRVPGIRPPTVPVGAARLRLSITLNVEAADIRALDDALQEVLA